VNYLSERPLHPKYAHFLLSIPSALLFIKEIDLKDLGEALELLPAPELKALAKTFHLGNSGTLKQQLVDGLLRLSRQKCPFSLSPAQANIGAVILKRWDDYMQCADRSTRIAVMVSPLASLTLKGQAAFGFLCAPVSWSSSCLFSDPSPLLSDGHLG